MDTISLNYGILQNGILQNDVFVKLSLLGAIISGLLYAKKTKTAAKKLRPTKSTTVDQIQDPYRVKPVSPDFKWNDVDTSLSYPFKNGEYKLTMGIKRLDVQDWLLVEPSYKKIVDTKYKIVTNNHPDYPEDEDLLAKTMFVTPECVPAIKEFYNIAVKYMCDKYPMCFEKVGDVVHNKILNEYIPAKADDTSDPQKCLLNLTRTIEEDVVILLKGKGTSPPEDEYYFKGGVFAFAAGFNPQTKINTPLSSIHKPVPGYESKLKVSMNRFFNRLGVGQFVTRSNFSIQTHNLYYVDDRNKGHNRPADEVVVPLEEKELDFDNQVFYRSERQTLSRLPESQAVVFTIRTYLQPLSELKAHGEEVSHRLVGAINGLPEDIFLYKNAREWSDAIKSYLLK